MSLSKSVFERVKLKLGITIPVKVDLEGLTLVYDAWSKGVGYDNINLIKFLEGDSKGTVPVLPVEDFFESWLDHELANFCWANSEALRALLEAFGFQTSRVIGSMKTWRKLPGNFVLPHGSLMVFIDTQQYLVDATFLIEEPLPINEGIDTCAGNGSLKLWSYSDGKIRWQLPQGRFDAAFQIERLDVSYDEFFEEHKRTVDGLHNGRLYQDKLYFRRNLGGGTITFDQGHIIRRSGEHFSIEKVDRTNPIEKLKTVFDLSDAALKGLPPKSFF